MARALEVSLDRADAFIEGAPKKAEGVAREDESFLTDLLRRQGLRLPYRL